MAKYCIKCGKQHEGTDDLCEACKSKHETQNMQLPLKEIFGVILIIVGCYFLYENYFWLSDPIVNQNVLDRQIMLAFGSIIAGVILIIIARKKR